MRPALALAGALVAATSAGATWWATSPRAEAPPRPAPPVGPVTRDAGITDATVHPLAAAVATGTYQRLDTPHGPVHVWIPAGYHADGAALVVYVHGYYTDVDAAWTRHQLPAQFALSGINAIFVACEAPSGLREPVAWTSLRELVGTVTAALDVPRPAGPLVAVGHSGAFRTLAAWLDDPFLDTVIAVDANYDQVDTFRDWVLASPRHRLVEVTEDTVRWSEELLRELDGAGVATMTVDRVPEDDRGWPAGVRDVRALLVRSQYAHMPLVKEGIVLPLLLRLVPVEILADAPWAHPLGDLPLPPT